MVEVYDDSPYQGDSRDDSFCHIFLYVMFATSTPYPCTPCNGRLSSGPRSGIKLVHGSFW